MKEEAPMLPAWIASVTALLLSASAWAADPEYQPYTPETGEAVSAPLFVVIAYSAIWLVLVGFVVAVWRRQREVQRELELLKTELARASSSERQG
jgi:CcmD family protein